ncbi:MAG: hypothetical protein QME47_07475, partial [Candidatus Thermoplasmatota archaeon]|nr:hypothetical protein [Candidatus Thermoplasmatota archaeon]
WTLQDSADGTKTVYFKCRNLHGDESEVVNDTIVLDTTPPSLQITMPQSGTITNKENITVEGEVRDLNGIEKAEILVNVSVYSLTLVDGIFSQLVELSNGTNVVTLRAKDLVGNWAEISITITYDPTIPSLIIYTPANNSFTNNSQCLVSGKTEPGYTLTVKGIAVELNEEGKFEKTITLNEGLNIINVTSKNLAGTETTVLVYITLDTAPPSSPKGITITPTTWTNVNSFTIDWVNPTDTSGIAGAWYKFGSVPTGNDDGTFSTQKPLVISVSTSGTTQIFVWLQDNAGNANCSLYSVVYAKYDSKAPNTTLLIFGQAGKRGWYITDVQVELSSSEDYSGIKEIWYSYEGSDWISCDNNYKLNITTPGIHRIDFYAVDNAGNIEPVRTEYIRIDKDDPYTSLTAEGPVGSPEWFVGDVQVTIEGHDDTSGVYAVFYRIGDEGEFIVYTSTFTITQEGLYKVYYYTEDVAGRTELTRCRIVGVDKTPPASEVDIQGAPGLNSWYKSQVIVKLTGRDNISGIKEIWYKLSGDWVKADIITIAGGAYTTLSLSDGIHNLSWYSVNSADIVEIQKTTLIKVDTQAPAKPVISSIPEFVNTSTIKITWSESIDSMSGLAGYILYWSQDANFSVYSETNLLSETSYTLALPEGSRCYFKVSALDKAGNEVFSDIADTLSDTTPPETFCTLIGQQYLGAYVTEVTAELYTLPDSSGVAKIYYSIGPEWLEYTEQLVFSENRTYVLKYYSIDKAGNIEQVKTFIFKIDIPLAQPEVDINEPNNQTVQGNATLTWSMESPVGDALFVSIIVLQADNGFEIVLAENLKNITSYTIDTTKLPNARYYIRLIVKDQHGRTVSVSTLTTIIVKNPYIQQLEINDILLGANNTVKLAREGDKAEIVTEITNREFNRTTFTVHFYLDGEFAGSSEITLSSLEQGTAKIIKSLNSGLHRLQVKVYKGNTLLEESEAEFEVQAIAIQAVQEETDYGQYIFWILFALFTIIILAFLVKFKPWKRLTERHEKEDEQEE